MASSLFVCQDNLPLVRDYLLETKLDDLCLLIMIKLNESHTKPWMWDTKQPYGYVHMYDPTANGICNSLLWTQILPIM